MKRITLSILLACLCAPAFAGKSCDELKSEIDAKIQANGVKNYSLEIVPADSVKEDMKDAKVVGSCEGGSKKIVYKKS